MADFLSLSSGVESDSQFLFMILGDGKPSLPVGFRAFMILLLILLLLTLLYFYMEQTGGLHRTAESKLIQIRVLLYLLKSWNLALRKKKQQT